MIEIEKDNGGYRQSNIELLRIICILFIICFHIVYHNDWSNVNGVGNNGVFDPEYLSSGVFILQSILPLGIIAVDVFVLITGYFLIYSNKIKIEKTLKLWIQMLFYSLTIVAVFFFCFGLDLTVEKIFRAITPVSSNIWWFCSSYLFLLLLSPFINTIVANVDERKMAMLLLLLLVLWFIIPLITGNRNQGNELLWFIIIYLIGGLIRKKKDNYQRKPSVYFSYALLIYIITVGLIIVFDYYDPIIYKFDHISAIVFRNSIVCLLAAIFVFLAFNNMKIKNNRAINYVASLTLGIYLLHEHPLVYTYIFELKCINSCSSTVDVILLLVSLTVLEFILCLIIESVRKIIFERYLLRRITKSMDVCIMSDKQ